MLVSPYFLIFTLNHWENDPIWLGHGLSWRFCHKINTNTVFRLKMAMLVALFHGFTSFLLESIFPCGLKGFPRLHFHWLRQLLQVSQTIETKGIFRAHWVTWHNNNIILKSGGFMNSTYSNLSHDNLHLTDVDFGNYILPGPFLYLELNWGKWPGRFYWNFKALFWRFFFQPKK